MFCFGSICCEMAELEAGQRNFEKAIKSYKEALVYDENNAKVSGVIHHLQS